MTIKPRYNKTPTAKEKAYHLHLIDAYPCACGCGRMATVVHHPLDRHPDQRWRRDHEFVVPMDWDCHMQLHRRGHERDAPYCGLAAKAYQFRAYGIDAGLLPERVVA